jgi:hypothetical protein
MRDLFLFFPDEGKGNAVSSFRFRVSRNWKLETRNSFLDFFFRNFQVSPQRSRKAVRQVRQSNQQV